MHPAYLASLTVPDWAIDDNRHVNNLAYLHWIQHASLAHSSANGWSLQRFQEQGWTWVVRNHTIDYLRPCFAGDRLRILTWLVRMGVTSSQRRFLFWRAADRKIVADARSAFVFVDIHKGEASPIPAHIRQQPPLPGLLENLAQEDNQAALASLFDALEAEADLPGIYTDTRPIGEKPPDFQFQRV
jgi:acyl-CoA thioester hydrolase